MRDGCCNQAETIILQTTIFDCTPGQGPRSLKLLAHSLAEGVVRGRCPGQHSGCVR